MKPTCGATPKKFNDILKLIMHDIYLKNDSDY